MAGGGNTRDVYVALLRGVNVGGKNSLTMAELVELFDEAGCQDVRTYIQSGNVMFRAAKPSVALLAGKITRALADRHGYQVPVVLRTAAELRAVTKHNPFLPAGARVEALHVVFLADRPTPARVAELDPKRSPPDEFVVKGREIYLQCPNGIARSKLTNQYFDSRLATTTTTRNWRTVLNLVELVANRVR